MKYKTAFRLAVKLLGVLFLGWGVINFFNVLAQVLVFWDRTSGFVSGRQWWMYLVSPAGPLAIGAYLFFDGRWVVDKVIPSNKPYCHECGYDLTGNESGICNECGTAFPMSQQTVSKLES